MTESEQPDGIDTSIESRLDTIVRGIAAIKIDVATIKLDVAVMQPQLDRVEKRLDGIDNRLWFFVSGILAAVLAALILLTT